MRYNFGSALVLDSLKNFTVDHWYKLLALVSAGVLGLALTVPLQVPNGPVALMAVGAFLFGLGQWVNHPLQERVGMGFKISGHPRHVHPGGLLLEIAGAGLIAWGAWRLL